MGNFVAIRPRTAKPYSESDTERGRWTIPTFVVDAFNCPGANAYLSRFLFRDLALVAVRTQEHLIDIFKITIYESTCVGGTVSFFLNVPMSHSTDRFMQLDKRLETINGVRGMDHATD